MERLKQVRLAGAVPPDHQHETGDEADVEAGIRAEAPERCPRDDQPASLIGMIR
jgi:hypothetical protein